MKKLILLRVRHLNVHVPQMAFVVLALLLILMPSASQASGFEVPCDGLCRELKLFRADNVALVNSVYQTKTVSSPVLCGQECSMDADCKSVNYHRCKKLCQLSNVTRDESPQDFLEDQGSAYFDTDEQTPVFGLARNDSCRHRSCKQLFEAGFSSSGVYTIQPDGFDGCGLRVYCDMETDGGGWIVFQRRQDGSVDFYRNWTDYQAGFGDLLGEFWLGNDNLVSLTSEKSQLKWELRIDLWGWDNNTAWAKYEDFAISGAKYTLSFITYDVNSTAGDALTRHNGRSFTTMDNDNDTWKYNCAKKFQGAWWFQKCSDSHLNGKYFPNVQTNHNHGISWAQWLGESISLKECNMKIRELAVV